MCETDETERSRVLFLSACRLSHAGMQVKLARLPALTGTPAFLQQRQCLCQVCQEKEETRDITIHPSSHHLQTK